MATEVCTEECCRSKRSLTSLRVEVCLSGLEGKHPINVAIAVFHYDNANSSVAEYRRLVKKIQKATGLELYESLKP